MQIAIQEAIKAYKKNEVPVGAVVVKNGKIIAKGYNKRNKSGIATKHAEIVAIEKACKKNKDWRLENCEIYVTLEPCPMCAGAIANARIKKLVFGAYDKTGDNKNLLSEILLDKRLNHKTEILGGVCQEKCQEIITNFFKNRRKKQKIH